MLPLVLMLAVEHVRGVCRCLNENIAVPSLSNRQRHSESFYVNDENLKWIAQAMREEGISPVLVNGYNKNKASRFTVNLDRDGSIILNEAATIPMNCYYDLVNIRINGVDLIGFVNMRGGTIYPSFVHVSLGKHSVADKAKERKICGRFVPG
ncbi:hypothetical protein ENBRE01_2689 [Enteropsectra breve]|nr:hypothetical protein ENBRE01_2689 [Enteropsectra breve]